MACLKLVNMSAMRRQHLLAEFAGLKQACPKGVFVSLTPGDPTLWSGVLFVRKGPYAPAVLRFQISFPDTYPGLPPLVTFATDMFHPLITPLTTYTYTTDIQENGTVSATDDERLPPGGFSLRHGFPDWFGRASRGSRQASSTSATTPVQHTPQRPSADESAVRGSGRDGRIGTPNSAATTNSTARSPYTPLPSAMSPGAPFAQIQQHWARRKEPSAYHVLRYIRDSFDDEKVLDSVPLEAAGNPGAWHAWRTYRHAQLQRDQEQATRAAQARAEAAAAVAATAATAATAADGSGSSPDKPMVDGSENTGLGISGAGPGAPATPAKLSAGSSATAARGGGKRAEDWDWEGVWEDRSKKCVSASLSEAVLYGSAGVADDIINFICMDDADLEAVKQNLLQTLGATGHD